MVHIRHIIRDGKTYAVRNGKEFEIVTVDDGVDVKAIKAKRGQRIIAFPWAYLVDVSQKTEGKATLLVAEYIYRRVYVCKSQTVTLPGAELNELGVTREAKRRALLQLEVAGIIRIEYRPPGHATRVTLTWEAKHG